MEKSLLRCKSNKIQKGDLNISFQTYFKVIDFKETIKLYSHSFSFFRPCIIHYFLIQCKCRLCIFLILIIHTNIQRHSGEEMRVSASKFFVFVLNKEKGAVSSNYRG